MICFYRLDDDDGLAPILYTGGRSELPVEIASLHLLGRISNNWLCLPRGWVQENGGLSLHETIFVNMLPRGRRLISCGLLGWW